MQGSQHAIAVPFLAQKPQALAEVIGAEVAEPGARTGRGQHRLDGELDRLCLAPGQRAALRLIQPRLSQVIDADVVGHGVQPTME